MCTVNGTHINNQAPNQLPFHKPATIILSSRNVILCLLWISLSVQQCT